MRHRIHTYLIILGQQDYGKSLPYWDWSLFGGAKLWSCRGLFGNRWESRGNQCIDIGTVPTHLMSGHIHEYPHAFTRLCRSQDIHAIGVGRSASTPLPVHRPQQRTYLRPLSAQAREGRMKRHRRLFLGGSAAYFLLKYVLLFLSWSSKLYLTKSIATSP